MHGNSTGPSRQITQVRAQRNSKRTAGQKPLPGTQAFYLQHEWTVNESAKQKQRLFISVDVGFPTPEVNKREAWENLQESFTDAGMDTSGIVDAHRIRMVRTLLELSFTSYD